MTEFAALLCKIYTIICMGPYLKDTFYFNLTHFNSIYLRDFTLEILP